MHTENPSLSAPASSGVPFPVVGIGASAGGFPALATLLGTLPPDPGLALVVILHLTATEPSAADKVLQRATGMPVVQVTHTVPILPNHVYVIPPGRALKMRDGRLVLDALVRSAPGPDAIDVFLCTLAEAHTTHAIGIVLSGMGCDGTAGLARIRALGGVTIAQLPADAEQGSMPRSTIDSGMVDFVLAADEIAYKLLDLADNARAGRLAAAPAQAAAAALASTLASAAPALPSEVELQAVLALLRDRTCHDFTHYRRPTLERRLAHRLQQRGVADVPAYLRLLDEDAAEAPALAKDLLIGVTSFFRDRAAFAALAHSVLPALFEGAGADAPGGDNALRVWAAACSTGEEAYTLAMLLADRADAMAAGTPLTRRLQIFASDIDADAIHIARAGRYPAAVAEAVPPAQLARYFTREGGDYKVRKALRDQILFTRHDLLQPSAFSRLDLITCRNLLIYLNPDMHRHVLEQFHFALKPGGYLMLGSAESPDSAADLFAPVDAAQRIYQARPLARPRHLAPALPSGAALRRARAEPEAMPAAGWRGRLFSFAEIHLHKNAQFAPPSILVDAQGCVVHVADTAAPFLHTGAGELTRELVALVAPQLQLALRVALFQAGRSGRPAATGPLRCDGAAGAEVIALRVLPFHDPHAEGDLMLVQFHRPAAAAAAAATDAPAPATPESALFPQVEQELRHTRRQLRDTIGEAETLTGELRVYNEEMQASIDALRLDADTLQHTVETLRAENLALRTAAAAGQREAATAAKVHDDLVNLVASSGVATIFLDRAMRIVRYTPRIADFFNVIPSDLGRPLHHITNRLDYPRLAEDAATVFDTLQPLEREVRDAQGRDYIVRVHPYRTQEHRIDGAVMTFFDITGHRAAETALRASEERFRLFVTASSDTLYRMNADWTELRNLDGMAFLADTAAPSSGWLEKYIPHADQPELQAAFAQAIADKAIFRMEHRVIRADGAIAWVFSRAVPLLDRDGNIVEWFGAAIDITRREQVDEARRASDARLAAVFEGLPVGVAVVDGSGTVIQSNGAMRRYLPNGVIPSRDLARVDRWRAWHVDGRRLTPDEFPGARALRGERVMPGLDMRYRGDDEVDMWTRVAAVPIVDENGQGTDTFAVVIDAAPARAMPGE